MKAKPSTITSGTVSPSAGFSEPFSRASARRLIPGTDEIFTSYFFASFSSEAGTSIVCRMRKGLRPGSAVPESLAISASDAGFWMSLPQASSATLTALPFA